MKKRFRILSLFTLFCAAGTLAAQMPNELEQQTMFRQAETLLKNAPGDYQVMAKRTNDIKRYNVLRILRDAAGKFPAGNLVYYSVPALSNIQRLPDQFPIDGKIFAPVDIVMARGEFEPGSFVLYSPADMEKIQLKAGDLKSTGGQIIPAADVDLKVVKVWYQNSNAWYNYFSDTTHKLVPELLVNDENLVRVDTVKHENYLRVDYSTGTKYIWISAPEKMDPGFNSEAEPVADAATIQPIRLNAGEFKQLFVTVRTSPDTAPGLYTGVISVGKSAKIALRVRVMPFVLPEPKTYYDRTKDFYSMLYCVFGSRHVMNRNGEDQEQANKKIFARLVNQKNHNVTSPLYMGLWNGYQNFEYTMNDIELAKKAGMKMDPFFEAFGCHATSTVEQFLKQKYVVAVAKKELGKVLGHTNLWPAGGEEPGYGRIVNARKNWKLVHDNGMHVMCNGGDRRNFSGYNDEFRVGGGFASKYESDFMHRILGRIGNYAGPHTGPENPDYMRRQHGLGLYKKDYDMMYNYGYHEGGWNDFHLSTYRCFNLVQYTKDGIIDTLAWEGIREGIDDIRYATLMMDLAHEAIGTGETDKIYAGKKALQFMALLNEDSADQIAARMEMIRHIMGLRTILGKGN